MNLEKLWQEEEVRNPQFCHFHERELYFRPWSKRRLLYSSIHSFLRTWIRNVRPALRVKAVKPTLCPGWSAPRSPACLSWWPTSSACSRSPKLATLPLPPNCRINRGSSFSPGSCPRTISRPRRWWRSPEPWAGLMSAPWPPRASTAKRASVHSSTWPPKPAFASQFPRKSKGIPIKTTLTTLSRLSARRIGLGLWCYSWMKTIRGELRKVEEDLESAWILIRKAIEPNVSTGSIFSLLPSSSSFLGCFLENGTSFLDVISCQGNFVIRSIN